MDPQVKKKLTVPFIILLGLLALNVNSVITGISQHNNTKIIMACASGVLVIACFVIVIRAGSRRQRDEQQ